MKLTTAFFALALALPAAAQQAAKEDPFKNLKYGDRVQITMKSGFEILGELYPLTAPAATPAATKEIPLEKATSILLDISLEYPELGGRKDVNSGKLLPNLFGFDRAHAKTVKKLPYLTPAQVAAREKAREEALSRMLAEENRRRLEDKKREEEREKEFQEAIDAKRKQELATEEGRLLAEAARLQKSRQLLERFPPEAGWGPEKIEEIKMKSRNAQPLTLDEEDFLTNYGEWLEIKKKLSEETKEKKEGTPTEAPK